MGASQKAPPHQIVKCDITATDHCPLRCDFCYNTKNPNGTWDEERCWKIVDFLLSQTPEKSHGKRRRIDLIWLGGEPLVHGEEVLDFIEAARAKHPDVQIASTVTTNLVPITHKWLKRAKRLNVPPHCSIDGIPEAHDLFRKFADGRGSSQIVMRHARWVLDAFPNASMRATVTPQNIEYMSRSIAWLAKFGFTDIAFSMASGVKWDGAALDEFCKQTIAVADWWVDCMRNGINPKVNWLDKIIRGIWKPERNWHICHAGVGRVAAATDGSLWPCHYFVGCNDERFRMGSLDDGLSEQGHELRNRFWMMKNQDPANHGGADCDNCLAVGVCNMKCIHACWADGGDIAKEPHWYCRVMRAYYGAAMRAHAILIREQNRFYLRAFGGHKIPNRPTGDAKPPTRIEMLSKIPAVDGVPPVIYGTPIQAEKIQPKPSAVEYKPKSVFILHWKEKGAPRALTDGLRSAGVEVQTAQRESCSWASQVNLALQSENPPEWLVVPQRLYKGGQSGQIATALEMQNRTRLLVMDFGLPDGKRSHYQTVVFDPKGENATSSVSGNFDRLAKLPTQAKAIEENLPVIERWSKKIRSDGEACIAPEVEQLRGKKFAVFFAQNSKPDKVLVHDAHRDDNHPPGTAIRFIEFCRKVGLVPVIKPHPHDNYHDVWSPTQHVHKDAVVISSGVNDPLCSWLMQNAKAVVMVNSTLVFSALALDAPVLQLGRGWCSGNGVVAEGPMSCLRNFEKLTSFDTERRERFLALMRSRQRRITDELRNPDIAVGIFRFFDRLEQEAGEKGECKPVVAFQTPLPTQKTPEQPKPLERPRTVRIVRPRRVAILARSITWPSGCSRRHIAIANWFKREGHEVAYFSHNEIGENRAGRIDCNVLPLSEIAMWEPDTVITGWPLCVSAASVLRRAQKIFPLVSYDNVRFAIRLADRGWIIAPISNHIADAFLKAGGCGDRMQAVLNGVDLSQFIFNTMSGRSGILWRDRSHRDAASNAQPPKDYPLGNALRGIGDVPLHNLIWEDKRANSRTSWDEAHKSYQSARLLCLNETVRAGGNNTILEAFACGCPVIANDIPATREMIKHGETGWLVQTVDEAATLAAQLYTDTDRLAAVAKNARRWVEQFSWDNYCEKLFTFMEENRNPEGEILQMEEKKTNIPAEVLDQLEKAFAADGGCFVTVSYKDGEPPNNLKHWWHDGQYPEPDKVPSLEHIINRVGTPAEVGAWQ